MHNVADLHTIIDIKIIFRVLKTYIFIIAGNHVSIGHLVAYTVSGLVGVVSPITALGVSIANIFVHLVSHDCGRRRLYGHGEHR